jgi:aspartyl-tRNA(Asn)/glutamyl-tRNA(Gln) amidotransferase subunit A
MNNQTEDVLQWSIDKISEKLKNKQLSPVELTKKTLVEIKKKDPSLNSFITIMEEEAVEQARNAEKEIMNGQYKGALHGIPIGLKDLIFTKGTRTTAGSEIYKDFIPSYDAEVVTRMKDSGVVVTGKLNMHEFAYGITGDLSYFGPVRNPHNPSKIAGGSSSGSGAAVAAGLSFASIGSDTGGSIRIPASCCGIVGMKPTFGRVSKHGAFPLCWTLDHLGPMTRTVKDNAIFLNAIAGYDQKDPYSARASKEDFTSRIGNSMKGIKVGVPTSFFFDIIQPDVQEIYNQTVDALKHLGATVQSVDLDHMDHLLAAQTVILSAEAYTNLEKDLQAEPEKVMEEVRNKVLNGIGIQASDYLNAMKVKHAALDEFHRVFRTVDLIMTPTLGILPTPIGERVANVNGEEVPTSVINRLTSLINTTGLPALSVPGGFSPEGLPVGIQLIGGAFQEASLYQVAHQIEGAMNSD